MLYLGTLRKRAIKHTVKQQRLGLFRKPATLSGLALQLNKGSTLGVP